MPKGKKKKSKLSKHPKSKYKCLGYGFHLGGGQNHLLTNFVKTNFLNHSFFFTGYYSVPSKYLDLRNEFWEIDFLQK